MDTHGHCVVCGVEGRGQRDFICEDCGGPDKNVLFCERCRTRTEVTEEAVRLVERHAGKPIPRRLGVTLKVSSCQACAPGEELTSTTVFLIR